MLASEGVLDKLHHNAYSFRMSNRAEAKPKKLTARQELVYRLLTDKGLTRRQVADALRISTQGVADHIAAIQAKGYAITSGGEGTDGRAANG